MRGCYISYNGYDNVFEVVHNGSLETAINCPDCARAERELEQELEVQFHEATAGA